MQFLCNKCALGGVLASGHTCKTCSFTTYSAYAYCVCCALEKDKCQSCETDMQSGRDQTAVAQVQKARAVFLAAVTVIDAEYDAAVADIKDEIDAWLKVNKDAGDAYDQAIKPYQDGYQTASEALRVLQSSGVQADSQSVIAARTAVDTANTSLREALPDLQKQMWAPINEARAKIGEEKLKRHEDAARARHMKTSREERRVELVAERIGGHLKVDAAYNAQLAQLETELA
ncbi:MAG: hypothetical protein IT342_17385 [Candidatus Melainabacteria bacterium]|nr:hypothetical protein [Candidatus Melainabacteria bacterium]